MAHFLSLVNRSHSIYTLRFNDILWHSTAVKLFMEPHRIHMFQDWAYEHITFRTVRHGGLRTKAFYAQCAQVGAFVLGSDGATYEPARQRARDILRKEACTVATSVTKQAITHRRVRRCVISQAHDPSALDAIAFGDSVSTEQPFCERQPAPYYCDRNGGLTYARGTFSSNQERRNRIVCNQTQLCPRLDSCPQSLSV